MILFDPGCGIADEAHAVRGQIVQPAEIVVDRQRFGVGIERIDGEIAPRGIVAPFFGKGDRRAPTIGRHIAAQGGDLDRAILEDGGHRAVVDPGGHGADARRPAAIDHGCGQVARGGIDIVGGITQQRVAHAAADPAQILRAQRLDQLREAGTLRPFSLRKMLSHPAPAAIRPGATGSSRSPR